MLLPNYIDFTLGCIFTMICEVLKITCLRLVSIFIVATRQTKYRN
jgi:hypothetical protein